MTFLEAEQFLSSTPIHHSQPSQWIDLGCGNGLFTAVLSSRLAAGSTVYAVDKASQHLLSSASKEVNIIFHKADFIKETLPFRGVHGVLMANSLHYVQNKNALLKKLKSYLLPTGVFTVIEYENRKANPWGPYPISFEQLKALFIAEGYHHIQKTGERDSVYGGGKMYVCSVQP